MSALSNPRSVYEASGWNDGRLGKAYDLIAEVLKERGDPDFYRNPMLSQIEDADQEARAPAAALDEQISVARRDMGPARWAQLNREWLSAPVAAGLIAGMEEGCA